MMTVEWLQGPSSDDEAHASKSTARPELPTDFTSNDADVVLDEDHARGGPRSLGRDIFVM